VPAVRRLDRRLDEKRDPDLSLQLAPRAFGGKILSGDPAVELVGLDAQAPRQSARAAEELRGVERAADEIRHAAYLRRPGSARQ
jgi:hypothetical protein